MKTQSEAFAVKFALLVGGLLFLGGCDPTIQTTVENGIINAANATLTSFFQALIQVAATSA